MEEAVPTKGGCLRKSLWLFFGLSWRPGVRVISEKPHGFRRFMASFLLTLLTFFGPSFPISVSLLLSLLLCVGLWSLKVLENEEPATTAGKDPLWDCLDPSPSCPFLSDGQLQAWQCLYCPAALGLHLIKLSLIVRGGELELGLSLTLLVSSRDSLKMKACSCIYPSFNDFTTSRLWVVAFLPIAPGSEENVCLTEPYAVKPIFLF